MEIINDAISRMQKHLGLLRMCMGMTQEEFGEELGVSRQQIWNLEHRKNKLTKLHYLAIQWMFHQKEGLIGWKAEEETGKFTLARMVYDFVIMSPELFNDEREQEEITSMLYSIAPLYLRAKTNAGRKMIAYGFCKELVARGYDDFYEGMKRM